MRKASGCPWIKLHDFIETSLWVSIRNVTSGTALAENEISQLIELADDGVTLQVPIRTCAQGQLVVVSLVRSRELPEPAAQEASIEARFEATAKVAETEALNSKSMTVTLKFYQYQELEWHRFVEGFSSRMMELNDKLRQMQD